MSSIVPDNNIERLIKLLFTDDMFNKVLSNSHADIIDTIHTLYKDTLVCVNIVNNKWYKFQCHRWIFVHSVHTLDELILSEVCYPIIDFCSKKLEQSITNSCCFGTTNGKNNDHIEYKKHQALIKFAENLTDTKFRSKIIKMCTNKLYDDRFSEKIDSNTHLIGFENGVYDLDRMCFRNGLPTDYVSNSVGYDWKVFDDSNHDDSIVLEKINKYFSEIQPNEDIRTYLLTSIARILRGLLYQRINVWTGENESLCILTNVLKRLLGQYFGTIPDTILTRRGYPPPELVYKSGKRLLIIQESILKNEIIDGKMLGNMRGHIGGDMIMAKPLYGDPICYKPQFTIILMRRNFPHISSCDPGTLRRLRIVPFGDPEEKIQTQDTVWCQALMWMILTKYYPLYEKGVNGEKYKIFEPLKLKLEQFTKDNCLDYAFCEFFEKNVINSDNDEDIISIPFLYRLFKDWYAAAYDERSPAKKCLIAYLKQCNYKMDQCFKKLIGFKIHLS